GRRGAGHRRAGGEADGGRIARRLTWRGAARQVSRYARLRTQQGGGGMSAATRDLELFVREALLRGQPRPAIETALVEAGWPPEQVRDALEAYAPVEFPVPVPRPRPYLSAREAFLYLLLFASLYVWAYHLGDLLFDLLNRALPDPADPAWQRMRADQSM